MHIHSVVYHPVYLVLVTELSWQLKVVKEKVEMVMAKRRRVILRRERRRNSLAEHFISDDRIRGASDGLSELL